MTEDLTFPQRVPHLFEPDPEVSHMCRSRTESGFLCGWGKEHHRWPCSPTCTHDDAWTPGHPERVKERSEAVRHQLAKSVHETHEEWVARCQRHAAERGAPTRLVSTYHPAAASAYEQGAEAMRAACLRDVVALLESTGLRDHGSDSIIQRVKAAIEGATP